MSVPTAIVSGGTLAEDGASVTGAQSLSVTAQAANAASATSNILNIGVLSGAGVGATAQVAASASTEALVDATATTVNVGSGAIVVEATSLDQATATPVNDTGALISISLLFPTATVGAPTEASFDGGTTTTGNFTVDSSQPEPGGVDRQCDQHRVAGQR